MSRFRCSVGPRLAREGTLCCESKSPTDEPNRLIDAINKRLNYEKLELYVTELLMGIINPKSKLKNLYIRRI